MKISSLLNKFNRRDARIIPKIPTYTKVSLIILTLIGITIFSKTILAQSNILKEKQDAIKKGNNQEAWLTEAMGNNLFGVMTMVTGEIPFEADGSVKIQGYIPGGVLGGTNKMIAGLYKSPASGMEYIAQVKDSFLSKPTYAADNGFGYKGLEPLLPIWKTTRNIIYTVSSLVFMFIGIALMLRVKISPQAVITIQSSLPKIITALVLVTFSYAISGLIIDLSNVFLTITIALFYSAKNIPLTENLFSQPVFDGTGFPVTSWIGNAISWLFTDVIKVFSPYDLKSITSGGFGQIYNMANRAVPAASGVMLGEVAGQIFFGVLFGGIGNLALGTSVGAGLGAIGAVGGDILGGVLGFLLLPIIMSILMVFWLIKLYFGLLKCYITLIIKIIAGPFEIFLGAFPNSKHGVGSWIQSIIANIAVFPMTIIFIVFLNYLTDILVKGDLWIPSQIDLFTFTGDIAGKSGILAAAGVGLAGLAMLSKLPSLIPEFVFSIKPSPFGKAIGEAYKPAVDGAKFGRQATLEAGGQKIEDWRTADDTGWRRTAGHFKDAAESMGIIRKKGR